MVFFMGGGGGQDLVYNIGWHESEFVVNSVILYVPLFKYSCILTT
jgi:hypothetical protein